MVEALSPLKTVCAPGRYGADGEAGIVLGTRAIRSLWQIAGWADFETAAADLLGVLGLNGLGDYRTARVAGAVTAWRIAPDKVLIEGCGDLTGYGSADLAVLDLSHARTLIDLGGPAARDLLTQIVTVDVRAATFKPGAFLQTGIHGVGVLIHCIGSDDFEIYVPSTWAESLWEVFCENALPHGLLVNGAG